MQFKKAILKRNQTIKSAIANLQKTSLKICFVCEKKKLLGTITDGDIRRFILKNKNLNLEVQKIMNKNYLHINKSDDINTANRLMKFHKISQIPQIDNKRNLLNVFFSNGINIKQKLKNNPVLIMAGGYGRRLLPLTKKKPKPLLPISGKPILEHIIYKIREEGFNNLYISTHYLAKQIENYFKNGKLYNLNIKYIREKKPLGTAGSLAYLSKKKFSDVLVVNGDVLTNISLTRLLEYHKRLKASATVAVRRFFWQHPYGVIKTKGTKIYKIDEKPVSKSFINAGLYVFKKKVLKEIKKNKKLEMTDFIMSLSKKKNKTIVYQSEDDWLDIGHLKNYAKAKKFKRD